MRLYRAAVFLLLLIVPGVGHSEEHFPGAQWEHLSAETVGWSGRKLDEAKAWSRQIGSTAVMIVQHGLVVAEWGDTAEKAPLASVRKSLLSVLIGIAVARHQINLDATLGSVGINDNAPSLSAEEKTATVRDLLEARSGVYHPACYETTRMADLRPARFSHKPGTFWYYNNWDFNALGTIYEQVVRSSVYDAFQREIAKPIGMQDYHPSDGVYAPCAESVHPAYTFNMSARDLARFARFTSKQGSGSGGPTVNGRANARMHHMLFLSGPASPSLYVSVIAGSRRCCRQPLRDKNFPGRTSRPPRGRCAPNSRPS